MDNITLKIPKKSEYMSTVRLTTSALANLNNFDIDEIEDMKVIISEACTFFIKNIVENSKEFEISFQVYQDKIIVNVIDFNDGQLLENSLNDDMSIMIIKSLSDNYNYDLNNKKITFEKIKL